MLSSFRKFFIPFITNEENKKANWLTKTTFAFSVLATGIYGYCAYTGHVRGDKLVPVSWEELEEEPEISAKVKEYGRDTEEMAKYLHRRGMIWMFYHRADECIKYCTKAIEIYTTLKGKRCVEVAKLYECLGYTYNLWKKNIIKGRSFYREAADIYNDLGLFEDYARAKGLHLATTINPKDGLSELTQMRDSIECRMGRIIPPYHSSS